MREEPLSPREATLRSMQEITGALIGIATALAAVFLPMASSAGPPGSSTAILGNHRLVDGFVRFSSP